MDLHSRPHTAFASTDSVPGSGSEQRTATDVEYIPTLQHPSPICSPTAAPSYAPPHASSTWEYLQTGSFLSDTSPSSQRTIVTPHIPSLHPLSCSSPQNTYSPNTFPSFTPLLDTLQQVDQISTPSPYQNDPNTLISVSNSPTQPHPSYRNSHLPFIDPQPSVRYDYNTPYTPPPIPQSRSTLLSPLNLNFGHHSDFSCMSSFTVDLNEDLNQSPLPSLPAPQPSRRAYVETVYSSSGSSPSSPARHSPLHNQPPITPPVLPIPTPVPAHSCHSSHDNMVWHSYRHTGAYQGSPQRLFEGGSPRSFHQLSSPGHHVPGSLGYEAHVSPQHSGGVSTHPYSTTGVMRSPIRQNHHSGSPINSQPLSIHHRPSFDHLSTASLVHSLPPHASVAPSPSIHDSVHQSGLRQDLEYGLPEPTQAAITIAQGTMKEVEVLKNSDNFVTWESQVTGCESIYFIVKYFKNMLKIIW
ncbi:hypothetical protein VKT23_006584 [Stygiomarasmius scandens]|uniref:Uncharacterized protein n=1 Tax=Marasmiellus scandens TaxID=2682957 RepID=A0ABR1JQ91_9AGAR